MRLATIDTLRGLAILAMILIHSAAYFLTDKAAYFLWNYSQFAVPIFFFCSSYLFFLKNKLPKLSDIDSHLRRRLSRLLKPFYIYLFAFFLVILIFEPNRLTVGFILRHLTMTTSTPETSWIVILFSIFSVLNPLLSYALFKTRQLFYIYLGITILSTIYLMFYPSPLHYKLIMWLPWSLINLFGLYFVKNERKNWFYPFTITATFVIFILTFLIQVAQNHPLAHFDNKYPPNLYYLSYGLFFITILFYIIEKDLFVIKPIQKAIHFLSIHSYGLFFIHFIVLYLLLQTTDYVRLGWMGVFLIVFGVSVVVQRAGLFFLDTRYGKIFK